MPARARWYCDVTGESELQSALEFARMKQLDIMVLGGGTNLVLLEDVNGLVIRNCLSGMTLEAGNVKVAAGENWHSLVKKSVDAGLFGIENLALIPGCVGAAPIQNIGAYGVELADRLISVSAVHMRSAEARVFSAADCKFGYRDSLFKSDPGWLITDISLDLSDQHTTETHYPGIAAYLDRHQMAPTAANVLTAVVAIRQSKLPDPAFDPNVGSFFKNPVVPAAIALRLAEAFPAIPQYEAPQTSLEEGQSKKLSAAWLIDQAGLKGAVEGKFVVSEQHALVIINKGEGSAQDLKTLVRRIRDTVGEKFGVALDVEPSVYPQSGLSY